MSKIEIEDHIEKIVESSIFNHSFIQNVHTD